MVSLSPLSIMRSISSSPACCPVTCAPNAGGTQPAMRRNPPLCVPARVRGACWRAAFPTHTQRASTRPSSTKPFCCRWWVWQFFKFPFGHPQPTVYTRRSTTSRYSAFTRELCGRQGRMGAEGPQVAAWRVCGACTWLGRKHRCHTPSTAAGLAGCGSSIGAVAIQAVGRHRRPGIKMGSHRSKHSPQVLELSHQVLELLLERARDGGARALAAAARAAALALERLRGRVGQAGGQVR